METTIGKFDTERDTTKTGCDEIPEYSRVTKGLIVQLMTLDDLDDERITVDKTFRSIPEDYVKVFTLYEFYKVKGESDEFRAYSLVLLNGILNRNGRRIVPTMEKDGQLEAFCHDLLEKFNAEAEGKVRYELSEMIGYMARSRNDTWKELLAFMEVSISSDNASDKLKAVVLMKYFDCDLPAAKSLLIESIMGSNPSLRKAALDAFECDEVDDSTLEMLIPIFIMMFEKGCSALPEELEKNTAPWKSLNEIKCNGEHFLAVDLLYSLASGKWNGLLSQHIERIFTAATETSLNEVDCKDGEVRHTALHLICLLAERHVTRIPNVIVSDIVIGCLLGIGRELERCMNHCPSSHPTAIENNVKYPTTVGHCDAKPILTAIGTERAGEHLIILTEAFFESEDWKRRGAALICWAILGRDWRHGLLTFLFDHATICLTDEHPRVRATAADLLADMFHGGCIRGDSDLLQKMVSSLVSLVDDSIHQVRASALVALVHLRSSVNVLSKHYSVLLPRLIALISDCPVNQPKAIHACAVDILIHLADQVGKTQFKHDFPQVEPALCALLSSLQPSYKHYHHVCASVQRLCHMVEGSGDLTRVIEKIRR